MKRKKEVLVILGPTATGKTDLALSLAKKFNGELIACDSRQVYKKLDVGTGKYPSGKVKIVKNDKYWEMDGIKVWMYDVVDPSVQYTVASYIKDANKVIENLLQENKLPIIVGGTGLYLKALLEGVPNLEIPVNKKIREELLKLDKKSLQKKLKALSLDKLNQMNESDKQNPRRLLRSIELILMNPYINKSRDSSIKSQIYNTLKIGLTASREEIYKRVDLRILSRINQGLIEEAEKLYKNGLSLESMKSLGMEYGVLARYLTKEITKKEVVEILKGKVHDYVRRQETWFKKENQVKWFDITDSDFTSKVEKAVQLWYDHDI